MKKSVLIVVDNLVMGGVTRVLANMLNVMSFNKYDVDLLVIHRHSDMSVDLPENVRIIEAGSSMSVADASISNLIKQKNIRKILAKVFFAFKIKTGLIKHTILKDRKKILDKQYDVEIAYGDGFPFFYVGAGNSKKKIAWMHYDVMVLDNSARYYSRMKKVLGLYDEYVAVSKVVAQSNEKHYGLKNVKVIHNVIDDKKIISQSNEEFDSPFDKSKINLISVGRLCAQKDFFRFVRVHKKLIDNGFNVNSYVVGDGEDREALEKEIELNGIRDSFFLLGRKDNPFPYVKNADIFVLPSRYEGLPTVVYEALVLGIPCVSTEVAGAKEIIDESCGIVTPKDDEELFAGIKKMLTEDNYKGYKEAAGKYQFSVDKIIGQIEEVL